MKELLLDSILEGMPGITAVEGANLLENCVYLLHEKGHVSPTDMEVSGMENLMLPVVWRDTYDEQMQRTYADRQSATERAAICISALLATAMTEYTIVERSRRGTGFDYFLGNKEDMFFMPKARLEVSGIEEEKSGNTLLQRYRMKLKQVERSDYLKLPVYIAVVEFDTPKSIFDRKETI